MSAGGGRLAGRSAIVTGAASGIGRATAEMFAAESANVLAVDLHMPDPPFASPAIVPCIADIASMDAPARIVATAEATFGGVDILFNNAGVTLGYTPIQLLADEDWERIMSVNLRAAFRLTREAVPVLRRSSAGRIIVTASTAAVHSLPGLGAYSVSKAAVATLVRGFAADLGPLAITCNAIAPGPTRTPIVAQRLAESDIASAWIAKTCLKRLGEAVDVARVALFLASDDSAYVTGQMLMVDGGFAASH